MVAMLARGTGARRAQTRRAGCICDKSVGLRLGRTASTAIADPLDLAANALRQNDPEQAETL
jgi:hypothetical protein